MLILVRAIPYNPGSSRCHDRSQKESLCPYVFYDGWRWYEAESSISAFRGLAFGLKVSFTLFNMHVPCVL